MQVKAYAKINLTLDILGRRSDGYHDISSVMQSVGLHDRLSVYLTDDPGVIKLRVLDWRSGEHESPAIPADETNLVSRAARAILEDTGEIRRRGAKVILRKAIPTQAGLGGGSTDAAATLRALNTLLGEPYSREKLVPMAAWLGADVPFFLWGGTCLVEGIGDKVTPMTTPPLFSDALIVKPRVGVSTPAAYRALDKRRGPSQRNARRQFPWDGRTLYNDFEDVVFSAHPELARLRDKMLACGCEQAALCGSGSAVFGTVRDEQDRELFRSIIDDKSYEMAEFASMTTDAYTVEWPKA